MLPFYVILLTFWEILILPLTFHFFFIYSVLQSFSIFIWFFTLFPGWNITKLIHFPKEIQYKQVTNKKTRIRKSNNNNPNQTEKIDTKTLSNIIFFFYLSRKINNLHTVRRILLVHDTITTEVAWNFNETRNFLFYLLFFLLFFLKFKSRRQSPFSYDRKRKET